ncbi:MAG: hypothetical protein JWR65_2828 [Massilia sp.]|nr:hypothetical protein [Massilia sp.]
MTDPDHAFLTGVQKDSFAYFVHEVNEANGLVADKTAHNWPASIAAVGMALAVYTIGAERGFMARGRAAQRTLTTLRFFANSEQSGSPGATGYKGFYYHFLDMETGKPAWDCELSSIDTALLIAGVLSSRAYFRGIDAIEREIRALAPAAHRSARTTAPWRRGQSSPGCRSRPTSSCPASGTTRACACAKPIPTVSRGRSRRRSRTPATARPAGCRPTTSASTKGRP